jgi:hypothetical protein
VFIRGTLLSTIWIPHPETPGYGQAAWGQGFGPAAELRLGALRPQTSSESLKGIDSTPFDARCPRPPYSAKADEAVEIPQIYLVYGLALMLLHKG